MSEIRVDTISEKTSANGVSIDSVTLKDGSITSTVADNSDNLTLISTDADANTGPILKLLRDSGSPADNDLCAVIKLNGDNDANEDTQCYEIRAAWNDVSNGTEDGAVRHALMVGGTLRDVMTLDSGIVVFNEESQDIDFRVESDGEANMFKIDAGENAMLVGGMASDSNARLCLQSAGNGFRPANINNPGSSAANTYGIRVQHGNVSRDDNTSDFIVMSDSGTTRCHIFSDGDIKNHDNSYGAISDERIKSNIVDANSQWDDIKAIKVRNWKRKDDVRQYGDNAWVQIGVVAQELEAAGMDKLVNQTDPTVGDIQSSSELGTLNEDGTIKEIKEKVKGVKYSVLYMKAIKALQEAMTRIETLEAEVTALKG
tara:strand:- start:836 stop:1951 length:1116 start_codon:yes stop_codon:yes gene_type:complete